MVSSDKTVLPVIVRELPLKAVGELPASDLVYNLPRIKGYSKSLFSNPTYTISFTE